MVFSPEIAKIKTEAEVEDFITEEVIGAQRKNTKFARNNLKRNRKNLAR